MRDIKAMLPEEIAAALAEMGQPKYRAKQIFQWLARGVTSFDEMTNLSKDLRAALSERFFISKLEMLRKQVSAIDGTIKYLWQLGDGNAVETVVMHYKHGNTVCISSQVGCRQGCAFCASTIGGLIRNLEPSEMLDEVLYSERESGSKISNIVLMGIGEPLDNFDNVMRFLALVNHPDGENIGMRHISLSTCGLIERFDDLAARDLQLTLSVSLHAPDDATRSKIMPANHGRGVAALIDACARYYEATGRRISFEYAMIDGVNDTPEHARLLAKHARRVCAHVNLIPLNHVEERAFRPSTPEHLKAFIRILERAGVNVTVRRKLGSDVDASCGQLRKKVADHRARRERAHELLCTVGQGDRPQGESGSRRLRAHPAQGLHRRRRLRRDGRRCRGEARKRFGSVHISGGFSPRNDGGQRGRTRHAPRLRRGQPRGL